MNKFLQYINDTLVSLDIPPIINLEDKRTYKRLNKQTNKTNTSPEK
ncbi:hypothetical protein [Olleya sp. R77988]